MSHRVKSEIYNEIITSNIYKISFKKNYDCCCYTIDMWCNEHTGLAIINEYDNNVNNCCIFLDCCTWCIEFRRDKYEICNNQTICYFCCCSIYFI